MRRAVELIVLWTLVCVLSLQPAVGIMNRKANSSSVLHFYPRREYFKKKSYLKLDRPLWVLEDKVSHPGEIDVATHRPIQKKPFISSTSFRPRLPSHYSNLNTAAPMRSSVASSRNGEPQQRTRMFPVFEDAAADPVWIFRGPKAEMIFNTMMTSRRYPMKEPVPGQVMYPPYSPKFKPTPVVERAQSTTSPYSVFQNVTLIPFYPHEAIDPRHNKFESNFEPMESPVHQVEVDYNQEETKNYLTQEDASAAHRPGCYHSFYSQDDVQSQYWTMPYTPTSPSGDTTPMSLIRNVPIPNGVYSNHRMEVTTPMPRTSGDSFRIMYPSDTDNAPPKRYRSVHTAKYGGFKTVYPIYTLNKLLKFKPQKSHDKPTKRDTEETTQSPDQTRIIWNSRYKTSNFLNPMSSRSLSKTHHTSAAALDTQILVQ